MSGPGVAAGQVAVEARSSLDGVDLVATVTAAPARVEVGLPVRLSLVFRGKDAGAAEVAWPAELGPFSVKPVAPREGERFAAELVTFDAGNLEIPAIPVTVAGRAALEAGPVAVESLSLRAGEFDPAVFHGLRGEVAEPAAWSPIAIAAVAAAAVGLAATAWFLLRRRPPAAPSLAPHEWALGELDRLAGSDLLARGEMHGFFVRLSDIVRGFVERRFGIDAPDRTTREFLNEARRSPLLGEERRAVLAAFLREADLVKFAGARPDPSRCDEALAVAREFVIGSIAAEAEEPTPPEASR